MTTRPNILAAIQACVTRSGAIDPAGLSAVRKAWEADRAALIDAEENNRGWQMQCATNEATVARLTRERNELRSAIASFLDAVGGEGTIEFKRLRALRENR